MAVEKGEVFNLDERFRNWLRLGLPWFQRNTFYHQRFLLRIRARRMAAQR
jgi:hypothetical protein